MRLPSAALLLLGLTSLAGGGASAQDVKPQPPAADVARRVSLRCTPRRLRTGDTLTLRMSVPHGRDLAVLSPDNKFFWLRSWEPGDGEATARWYAFERGGRLMFVAGRVKGRGGGGDELVFTKTGWYRIRVSYNLETDDGTPVSECKVYYVQTGRPARRRT